MELPRFPKWYNIPRAERDRVGELLKQRYDKGASVSELQEETGRSHGWVLKMLRKHGAQLRGRGGPRDQSGRAAPSALRLVERRWLLRVAAGEASAAEAAQRLGLDETLEEDQEIRAQLERAEKERVISGRGQEQRQGQQREPDRRPIGRD